jgi:CRP-like cAMP-binding protein
MYRVIKGIGFIVIPPELNLAKSFGLFIDHGRIRTCLASVLSEVMMEIEKIVECLRQNGAGLSALRFRSEQVIYYPGNMATGLYLVQDGKVKLERGDEWGRSQILGIVGPGQCIGFDAVFTRRPHHHLALALTDVCMTHVQLGSVPDSLFRSPELMRGLLRQMATEHQELQIRLGLAFGSSAQERISDAIVKLRELDPERTWTRRDIAEWAGTTPETVTRMLQEMEKEGLVILRGRSILLTRRFLSSNQRH